MGRIVKLILCGLGLLGLVACEGGVSGSSTSQGGGKTNGMEMPVTLSVVTTSEAEYNNGSSGSVAAVSSGQINGLAVNTNAILMALTDPTTQYSTDSQRGWVQDDALKPLQQVNNILCYVNQLRTDAVVNEVYVALVDPTKCERQGQDTSGQNQSDGQAVQMVPFIVDSRRASNFAPQYVSAWIEGNPGGGGPNEPPNDIKVYITITEGISDTNPYGQFEMNIAGIATADWTSPDPNARSVFAGDPTMMISLTAFREANGGIGFTFFEESYIWDYRSQASVVTDAAQTSGYAHTGGRQWDGMQTVQGYHSVAFTPTNVLSLSVDPLDATPLSYLDLTTVSGVGEKEKDPVTGLQTGADTGAVCTSRAQFDKKIWRYDLYHAVDGIWNGAPVTAGERVRVNSGFPFMVNINGTDMYGYAGYWGIWAENPPASWEGVQVAKMDFNGVPVAPTHTLHESNGKMIRKTRELLLLSKLDGELFSYGECGASACIEYQVEYTADGTLTSGTNVGAAGFYKIATLDWTQPNPATPLPSPLLLDVTVGASMWSQTMNGGMYVNDPAPTANAVFYRRTVVNSMDPAFTGGVLTLECWDMCPKPGMHLDDGMYLDPWDLDGTLNPAFYPSSPDGIQPAAVYQYDAATMRLNVIEAPGGTPASGEITAPVCGACGQGDPWGINSGNMIPQALGLTGPLAWDAPVSFTWETGHNIWNKLSYVTENASGNQVVFDPPISFLYTHLTANDANLFDGLSGVSPYEGKAFMVQYSGNGDFHGIPSEQDASGRWTPKFGIRDGTLMGETNQFAIKAREMELNPQAAPGECATAGLELGLPDTPLPLGISGTPLNITDPAPVPDSESPRVVDGEVVDSSTYSAF